MVRANLAVVSNELEAANNLANGEEAEGLGEDDTAGGKLGHADISYGVDEALGGSEDAAAGNGLPEALVEGLEGSGGGDGHLLVLGDVLAQLEGDLAVVDDEGSLTLEEANGLAGRATQLADGLGGAGEGRASGAGDSRQALGSLVCGVLGGSGGLLSGGAGLLGGGALEAAGGELPQDWGAQHRARE